MRAADSFAVPPGAFSCPEAFVEDVAGARRGLAHWILNGGLQLAGGAHAGGVCGQLSAQGEPIYVYPEITGYYLQWLAWHAHCEGPSPELKARAEAAQRWLGQWALDGPRAPTRIYLRSDQMDWRNHATFCFDLAMVVRGLGAAHEKSLLDIDSALVDRLCAALAPLIAADGCFNACVPHDARTVLPCVWSTGRGPFLAKAASGILAAARELELPAAIRSAATTTLRACFAWAIDLPHDHSHAFLYTIEGLACDERVAPPRATMDALLVQFVALLARTRTVGFMPESPTSCSTRRLDIVGQAIRAAVVLRAHGFSLSPHRRLIDCQVGALVSCLQHGYVPFDARDKPGVANGWATLFAEQALAWSRELDYEARARCPYLV